MVLLLFLVFSLAGCTGGSGDSASARDSGSGEAAPWLQRGFDARGTFAPSGEPPEWSDVALEVPLEGQPQREIVVIDRQAYVLVERGGLGGSTYQDAPHGPSALVRVDLDAGTKTTLAEWDSPVDTLASDGTRLFATVDEIGVVATTLEGEELWRYLWPTRSDEEFRPNWAGCFGGLNVAGDGVTVGCEVAVFNDEPTPADPYTRWKGESYGIVARVDAETGEERWRWESNATSAAEVLAQEDLPAVGAGNNYAFPRVLPMGISVEGDAVVFLTQEFGLGVARSVLVALDNETGAFRWSDTSEPIVPSDVHYDRYEMENPTTIPASVEMLLSRPTLDDNLVLVKHDGLLQAFNVGTGALVWERGVGQQDPRPELSPVADLAVVDDRMYVASAQNLFLYTLGSDDTTPGWQTNLNPDSGETFEEGPLVVGSTIFMGSWAPETNHAAAYAFDAEGGDLLWRLEWPASDLGDFAYSDGLVVFADRDRGTLFVIGTTDASIDPYVDVPDAYPAAGAEVVVNLSGTAPGAQGPASEYRATWGDGSQTDWQAVPVVTHVYDSAGDATARFEVRNEAGQTATTTYTFHVGDTPPSEPNLVATAFERDNQDLTFGILGILLALGGGVLALTRRHT